MRLPEVVIVSVTCPVCDQEILIPVTAQVHGATVDLVVADGGAAEAHVRAHLN